MHTLQVCKSAEFRKYVYKMKLLFMNKYKCRQNSVFYAGNNISILSNKALRVEFKSDSMRPSGLFLTQKRAEFRNFVVLTSK